MSEEYTLTEDNTQKILSLLKLGIEVEIIKV